MALMSHIILVREQQQQHHHRGRRRRRHHLTICELKRRERSEARDNNKADRVKAGGLAQFRCLPNPEHIVDMLMAIISHSFSSWNISTFPRYERCGGEPDREVITRFFNRPFRSEHIFHKVTIRGMQRDAGWANGMRGGGKAEGQRMN